jgi:hypothetical protein
MFVKPVKAPHQAVLSACYALFDDLPDIEMESEMMRRVGFDHDPGTAEEFVLGFIADRTS